MNLFTQFIYQPFLNVLVLFYWAIGQTTVGYDMGVAVILLTVFIRILLLPMTLMGHRTEKERREIEEKIKELTEKYSSDPVRQQKEIKQILRVRPRILIAEGIMFSIQLAIFFLLLRLFSKGLGGEDLHLLYSWVPEVPQPYNLTFWGGRFDLTHPDFILNLAQSIVIFLFEAFALVTSPYPTTRQEIIRVQFILPVVSFIAFAFLPAGKKLFVITTLLFSLAVSVTRHALYLYHKYFPEPEAEEKPEQYVMVPESVMVQLKEAGKKSESESVNH